tara:strand:+ start:2155 stop:3282 length:1128 start_codon:yes stop_codon:yes gene_type:complete
MYYFIYPDSDTTIYEGGLTQSLNAGIDPILEVQKLIDASGTITQASRTLIKFDYSDIIRKRNQGAIPTTAKYYLNLYDAGSQELKVEQTVDVYMISGSWTQGSGKSDSNPVIDDGASWKYRSGTNQWKSGSATAPETMGGAWFTSSLSGQYEVSNSFDLKYETKDLRIEVTDLVNNQILSSSIYGNNGFLLKRPDSAETSSIHFGDLKFFSKETHTIYPPKLEVEWDDSVWNTGSLSPLSSTDLERLTVYFKGIRPEYKEKSKVRFRLVGRELYPTRGFDTTPAALNVKTLPSGSMLLEHGTYYSIEDDSTGEVIIPFSTGSIVSCDSQGNFFNIDMNAFQPERYYKFLIKVVSGSGADQLSNIYDDGFEFKVVR